MCANCGEPSPSRSARLCNRCRPAHRAGLGRDYWLDRFGEPRWNRWTIREAIGRFVREYGRLPTFSEWSRPRTRGGLRIGESRRRWPPSSVVQKHYGSWNAAIEAAGFTPRPRQGEEHVTCKLGHPLSGDNLYVYPDGERDCRTCRRERGRRFRERARARASA